jgi:hypothetical protein
MSGITAAAQRAGRAGRGLLPSGQLLTPQVWARRHRGIVWVLWAHVAGIVVFAVLRGYGVVHGLQEAMLVALFALPAAHPAIGRRAPSGRVAHRKCGGARLSTPPTLTTMQGSARRREVGR